jgi:hypothetical protein
MKEEDGMGICRRDFWVGKEMLGLVGIFVFIEFLGAIELSSFFYPHLA